LAAAEVSAHSTCELNQGWVRTQACYGKMVVLSGRPDTITQGTRRRGTAAAGLNEEKPRQFIGKQAEIDAEASGKCRRPTINKL